MELYSLMNSLRKVISVLRRKSWPCKSIFTSWPSGATSPNFRNSARRPTAKSACSSLNKTSSISNKCSKCNSCSTNNSKPTWTPPSSQMEVSRKVVVHKATSRRCKSRISSSTSNSSLCSSSSKCSRIRWWWVLCLVVACHHSHRIMVHLVRIIIQQHKASIRNLWRNRQMSQVARFLWTHRRWIHLWACRWEWFHHQIWGTWMGLLTPPTKLPKWSKCKKCNNSLWIKDRQLPKQIPLLHQQTPQIRNKTTRSSEPAN